MKMYYVHQLKKMPWWQRLISVIISIVVLGALFFMSIFIALIFAVLVGIYYLYWRYRLWRYRRQAPLETNNYHQNSTTTNKNNALEGEYKRLDD